MNAARSFLEHGHSRVGSLISSLAERKVRLRLETENSRLMQENEVLRQRCADLTSSAELWIGLYEAALARLGTGKP